MGLDINLRVNKLNTLINLTIFAEIINLLLSKKANWFISTLKATLVRY